MLRDLEPASKYFFRVRAFTDAGFGPYSETVSASSDDIDPIPRVVISSQESIQIVDLDSGESVRVPKSTGIPIDFGIIFEENVAYWVNNLEEIFSSRINSSGNYKLTSINGSASSICVDWVSRSVYWTQLEITSTDSTYVMYRADLGIPSNRPHITRVLTRKQAIYSLQIAPMLRSLYWYEESNHTGLGNLLTLKLDESNITEFFNKSEACDCPRNKQVARTFVLDMTNNNTNLFWVDLRLNQIYVADILGCTCNLVVDATERKKYGFIPTSITVDSKYIYWYNSTEKFIFYRNKFKKSKIEQAKSSLGYKIMALDPGNQPYPPKHCLYPNSQKLLPKFKSHSANSITLQLPHVKKPNHLECENLQYELPATEYTIFYRSQIINHSTVCDRNTCPYLTTTNTEVILNELKPFTNYSIMLEATNYYSKLHEVKPISGMPIIFLTAAEAPTAPKNVTGIVLSPVLARVEWTPDPGLWYELHWKTDDSTSLQHRSKEHIFEMSRGRSANMTGLSPATAYTVWVRAHSRHSAVSADSRPLRLRTKPDPAPLAPAASAAYELRVAWPPPAAARPHRYGVEYTEVSTGPDEWKACERTGDSEWTASDLRPRTRYRFRLRLQYVPDAPPYLWPDDDRFTYETIGDVPGAPGAPRAEAVGERVLRVWWGEPPARGAPVTHYRLWGRPEHRLDENDKRNVSEILPKNLTDDLNDETKSAIIREGLELLHNGSQTYWLVGVERLSAGALVARVQARNSYGWSALSAATRVSGAAHAAPRSAPAALALALAALAALVIVVVVVLYAYNHRSKKKTVIGSQLGASIVRRGPDVELATLRQLPIRHSNNILYNQGVLCPSDAELASLPHIRREQITLSKFLGSGAFGEVFEGVARQINNSITDTKVAVKTLRKGATEQEKTEFLKEAALMSNFKHEHILRLLGVCLDNDPHYIVMELMEGGDLLSYLRAKRASLYTPESLTLLDLLNMCVDVTRGCRYLEEMHFVHRDLACRNCLVATRVNTRVVKIGDFGLARDIYKNDYYRKEGEGLLPVRWMAVECLVDGVFSCQSDVWAWGVLCWEVLSLGRQPYPARTNRQVLALVRAGGTPDRPPNCPSTFYELLQKCWSYSPEARPSFRQCLEVVCSLRDGTAPREALAETPAPPAAGAPSAAAPGATLGPPPAPHYLTLLGDDEDYPEQEMEPSHLLPQRPTKYLELMYDGSPSALICDGYEIPRAPFPYAAFSRHSIVGVAPNRLIKPPLYRTRSLRTSTRPPNATIVPLRNGIMKRASLCDGRTFPDPGPSGRPQTDLDGHVFKTPF